MLKLNASLCSKNSLVNKNKNTELNNLPHNPMHAFLMKMSLFFIMEEKSFSPSEIFIISILCIFFFVETIVCIHFSIKHIFNFFFVFKHFNQVN